MLNTEEEQEEEEKEEEELRLTAVRNPDTDGCG